MAAVPIDEPMIARVSGEIITPRIRNGIERRMLTITPSTVFSTGMGRMPFLSLTTSSRPSGRPIA